MSYSIGAGIWSSVFAVPTAVVDEHIKMCSPLSLKILLVMLRHGGRSVDASWLSAQLNIPAADVADALGYWVGVGLVCAGDAPMQMPPPSQTPPEPVRAETKTPPQASVERSTPPAAVREQTAPEGQRVTTVAARQKLSRDDIAALATHDPSLSQLLQEAQSILGAPLTPVESEILCALTGYYGFPTDALLMLLQYCVSAGHKSMHYLEKTAAGWLEKGIDTHEKVEAEIRRLTRNNENEMKIIKAFGLYNRGLTAREREFCEQWFALGLPDTLLALACERAAENTGKVSFAYADKILTSWKQKGICTVKAAVAELNAGAPRAPTQNKSAQTGESSLDMDKIHRLLHGQLDG